MKQTILSLALFLPILLTNCILFPVDQCPSTNKENNTTGHCVPSNCEANTDCASGHKCCDMIRNICLPKVPQALAKRSISSTHLKITNEERASRITRNVFQCPTYMPGGFSRITDTCVTEDDCEHSKTCCPIYTRCCFSSE